MNCRIVHLLTWIVLNRRWCLDMYEKKLRPEPNNWCDYLSIPKAQLVPISETGHRCLDVDTLLKINQIFSHARNTSNPERQIFITGDSIFNFSSCPVIPKYFSGRIFQRTFEMQYAVPCCLMINIIWYHAAECFGLMMPIIRVGGKHYVTRNIYKVTWMRCET